MAEAYIVSAARTAGGRKGGRLSGWHPADLAGQVLDALVERADIDPAVVDDVIMGCVTQSAEQSGNVARNAILSSKLPESVPGVSVDRQCGSSQQAIHFAAQAVMSGVQDVVIAAGVESMSRVPMGLSATLPAKNGFGHYVGPAIKRRYGEDIVFSQFAGAESLAVKYDISREDLDRFSLSSHQKAVAATEAGKFTTEIVPIKIAHADGAVGEHIQDEGIRYDASLEAMASLKLLREDGRLSAASSSQVCDGAAGVLVVSERGLKSLGLKPLARIHHMTVIGHDPVIMLEGPVPATKQALQRTGMKIDDIDLFEVNEAFASVPLAWIKGVGADPSRVNVYGGAISLGHPLGASGAKLMTTLIHALEHQKKRYGLQTMCEGGGLANVTIVERL